MRYCWALTIGYGRREFAGFLTKSSTVLHGDFKQNRTSADYLSRMKAGRDTRTRILLYFLLGIAIPSGLLGYLAFRGIRNERALIERERRTELEANSEHLTTEVESQLLALERRVAGADPGEFGRLVEGEPALRAIFTVDSALEVRVVAAEGLLFEWDAESGTQQTPGASDPLLINARRRELSEGDLRGALNLYRRTFEQATREEVRGEALAGLARVQRKLGQWTAAIQSYELLSSDLGEVRTSGGIPLVAAARLELGTLHLELHDSTRAARVALDLYTDLVDGRWVLTPARFDLLASAAHELIGPLTSLGESELRDTVVALSAALTTRREDAATLREFEANAIRALLRADHGEGAVRRSVDVGTQVLATILLPETADESRLRSGLIFYPRIVVEEAVATTWPNRSDRFAWSLRTPARGTVAGSGRLPAPEAPTVVTGLADLAGWSLTLTHSREALRENFLTSRRAVYLCAFILIGGILVSGLFLTVRTVGRELELARMKADFVSTVSHEFKSPLTAIRQLAEMLRGGRVPSEERRTRYYDVLLEQSERLSLLVDNILDFERAEDGRRRLVREPVYPAALVEDTVEEVRHRVAHEQFTIRTEIAEALPEIALDRDAFRQSLTNLIDNAVKYSGGSREIVVRAYQNDGNLVVAVQDFGIGLEPEQITRVFERFYRGGDELTRNVRGTGLGLALVKRIVEAHGGTIEVQSVVGHGSTFSVRFPVGQSGDSDGP